ncbi:MAG: PAC2 family protein [Thermoplasmatota archaeon]
MDDISIIEYKDFDLENSMLIVAFPTVGLISSIAGHFIINSLKLELIGSISSGHFTPAAVIHKTIPSPPVRIYAGKKKCGPDNSCSNIVIIISEFMPSAEVIKPLVEKIFRWAEKKGCKIILTLEGMHTSNDKEKKPKVFGVGTTDQMKKMLKKFNINQTQEGMITGVTGVLLYEGVHKQRNILCLLAGTQVKYPDSRAAASLLEQVDKMLPAIKIDPKPLYEAAKEIEDKILQSIEQSKPTAPTIQPAPYSMYH